MPTYITVEDLSKIVPGSTAGYWAQLRFTGKGPAFIKPSAKKVLYREDVVFAWLDSLERISTVAA